MGKIKKGRSKPSKKSSVGIPSQNDEEVSAVITPNEVSVQAAKEQLQSPNIEEKLCGLQTLATILESADYEKALVEHSIVRVAAPLLLDPDMAIRNATAGTLRNFSTLGLDACEYLVGQDIMTPLIEYFKKHANEWVPKRTPSGKLDEDGEAFLHCVNLLWNLGESSGLSVKYFNECNIIAMLMKCLDVESFGKDIVAAILHCIFTVTDDNPKAAEYIKSQSLHLLINLFSLDGNKSIDLLIKILAAGIILNVHSENFKSLPTDVVGKLMLAISSTLEVDLRTLCNQLSSVLPLTNKNSDSESHKQNQNIENQVNDIKCMIDAQQTAVEIMTNICSCEDDDKMDTDDISDEESDMEDEFINCTNNGSDNSYTIDNLPVEIIECVTGHNLVENIMAKTVLPPENVLQIFQESESGKHIYKRLCILQSISLLCMNNLISNLPIEMLNGHEGIYKIWMDTVKRVFRNPVPYVAKEIMEASSAVMRASLDRLKDIQDSTNIAIQNAFKTELTINDIKFLLDGITDCQYDEIRSNLTRMVGNIGLILTKGSECSSSDILLMICEFLFSRLSAETECWLLADVIDTLMDLFAEDETDLLAKNIHLVDKLNHVRPIFKNKVRQQRKTLGDHSAVVSTVVTNLPRFIEYKKKRIANIK